MAGFTLCNVFLRELDFCRNNIDITSFMMYNYIGTSYMVYNLYHRRNNMNVHHYETSGGKDLILEYIDNLPKYERAEGLTILNRLEDEGIAALDVLNTRQLRGKLWEIKFYNDNRIMYVVTDGDNIYLVHACKKQKGKAEKYELNKAIKRVKELEKELGKRLI